MQVTTSRAILIGSSLALVMSTQYSFGQIVDVERYQYDTLCQQSDKPSSVVAYCEYLRKKIEGKASSPSPSMGGSNVPNGGGSGGQRNQSQNESGRRAGSQEQDTQKRAQGRSEPWNVDKNQPCAQVVRNWQAQDGWHHLRVMNTCSEPIFIKACTAPKSGCSGSKIGAGKEYTFRDNKPFINYIGEAP